MLVKCYSGTCRGIDAILISIEVHISQGIRFFIVGLADSAIRESQQRIESALTNNGFDWPRFRVVINLAPADIRKEGTHFDLPLAMGILAASGQLNHSRLREYLALGELSLDGGVVAVKGMLPMVLMARRKGFRGVIVPLGNRPEASVVEGIEVIPVRDLKEVVAFLEKGKVPHNSQGSSANNIIAEEHRYGVDYADVRGQEMVKRAMLIAATGMHNILMIGPPGSGKSMMARRLPTIMPPLNLDESLQTTAIHSVAGKIGSETGLIRKRPFRMPHHSISDVAMIGGGNSPQPGEISLAHHGLLFLDELPEFRRHVLEVLRQPLEDKEIQVCRASYRVKYPADFMLVAAMNPCPCGYYNHPERSCRCSPGVIARYLHKISGPFLDRMDIHIEVVPVPFGQLAEIKDAETSDVIRDRVMCGVEIQRKRFAEVRGVHNNAQMTTDLVHKYCVLEKDSQAILKNAMEKLGLSARAYGRSLKVSRTIADLDNSEIIRPAHVSEAISYRILDRENGIG
jgi:magnesium chelatase family protein